MAKYVRIRSYQNGVFTTCEHLYSGSDHLKALEMFNRDYPEHKQCTVIAEDYDSDNYPEHFAACKSCDCVHFCS